MKIVMLLRVCLWLAKGLWNVLAGLTAGVGALIAAVVIGFAFGIGLTVALTPDTPAKDARQEHSTPKIPQLIVSYPVQKRAIGHDNAPSSNT